MAEKLPEGMHITLFSIIARKSLKNDWDVLFLSEILSYIFSYLTLTDKLQCRLVCKGWQFAFLDPRLHEKTFISFVENDEGLLTAIYGGLLDSNVPGSVRKIHFEKVEVGK